MRETILIKDDQMFLLSAYTHKNIYTITEYETRFEFEFSWGDCPIYYKKNMTDEEIQAFRDWCKFHEISISKVTNKNLYKGYWR